MTFFYPNGQPYHGQKPQPSNGIHPSKIRYDHRGMTLEEALNITNRYYLESDRAVIYKKPTPIQIVHVDYPKRSAAKITEAYFRKASTTDYNGVYRGKYIDFEAKETTHDEYLPLKNFHEHQVQHMARIRRHGGIGFIIVRFIHMDAVFLLDAAYLESCWQEAKQASGRKSISRDFFEKKGYLVPQNYLPRIDYLHEVDKVYF